MGGEKVKERVPAHVADPGKGWRQLARWGAAMCLLATLWPFGYSGNLWTELGKLSEIVMGKNSLGFAENTFWLILVFCCFGPVVYLGGPCLIIVCGRNALQPGSHRFWQKAPLILLWLGAFIPPFCFFLIQLNRIHNKDLIAILIGSTKDEGYRFGKLR